MLLAIDVGNTHSVFALCDDKPRHVWRLATDHTRTGDSYAVKLLFLMQETGVDKSVIDATIISSVVPDTVFHLWRFCENYLGHKPLVVGRDDVKISMPVDIHNPRELGADRLVNAIAAWDRYKEAMIVIDFGTATTFDVINKQGHYVGGAIAPGVNISLDALSSAAAKLHGISIRRPEKAIGTNTTTAMQSGVYHGYMGLIDGLVSQISAEIGYEMKVIATGGLAELYGSDNPNIHEVDRDLTVRGLQLIYQNQ